MKTRKITFLGIVLMALCLAGCTKPDDNNEGNNGNNNGGSGEEIENLAQKILGGWGYSVNDDWYATYYFNKNDVGKLNYQYTNNYNGIMANASYTVNGSIITASFNQVTVTDSDFNPTTMNGFTDGQPITVTYTVQSITDNELVMKESVQGQTLRLERYN